MQSIWYAGILYILENKLIEFSGKMQSIWYAGISILKNKSTEFYGEMPVYLICVCSLFLKINQQNSIGEMQSIWYAGILYFGTK